MGITIKSEALRICGILALLFLSGILRSAALSQEMKTGSAGDIILGAGAGYSILQGHYAESLRNSYRVNGSLMYGNFVILKYLMGGLDIAFGRYPMKESGRSYLQSLSASIGPILYIPAAAWLHLFTGASFRGSYLHLHTVRTDRNVRAIKPGFEARAGMFFPVGYGFRLRVSAEYSLEYLSGKALHGINLGGGLSYNFNPAERTGGALPGDPGGRVDWYLSRAGRALAAGRIAEAKANYASVLAIDRNNASAREKVAAIQKAESDYARAKQLATGRRYVEALPLLDEAGVYLEEARAEAREIRKLLAGETAALGKEGIRLYESGDYRGCIAVMKRLLLIDPRNSTGLIYLPRAQKRQAALEKLR